MKRFLVDLPVRICLEAVFVGATHGGSTKYRQVITNNICKYFWHDVGAVKIGDADIDGCGAFEGYPCWQCDNILTMV